MEIDTFIWRICINKDLKIEFIIAGNFEGKSTENNPSVFAITGDSRWGDATAPGHTR